MGALSLAEDPSRVLVLTGTEPQPFQRLADWVDAWASKRSTQTALLTVQHGTARPLQSVDSIDYLLHDEIASAIESSRIVIGSVDLDLIRRARANGRRIIAVPRRSARDETLEDQLDLGRGLAQHDHILLAETENELHFLLDRALTEPSFTDSLTATRSERAGRELQEIVQQMTDSAQPLASVTPLSPTAGKSKVPVLYVGGLGRSGSTLLNDILGQHTSVASAGELVHIWQRGLVENNLCGCGEHFLECEFWTEVGERAFGGWDQLDLDRVMQLKTEVDRNRFVSALLAPWLFRSIRQPLDEYGEILVELLRAIRDVAGVPVVVDSSKQISTALMLKRIDGIDLKVVHLIRDARGVAYSWTKTKTKVEVTSGEALMNQYHPGLMGWRWLSWNAVFGSMRALGVPVLTVHYEAMIDNPRSQVSAVLEFAGVEAGALGFVGETSVDLEPIHSVAGNPSRFKHGNIELALDEAWRQKLPRSMRMLVSVIAFPLLRRYGYLGKGGRRDH
ncbi:MAG: sulfotransferase [Acidimicrobiales bacterium]